MQEDPKISSYDTSPQLTPLTADFIESEHTCYVLEINRALKTPGIHNIALSGNFGVGKSSILKELAKSHEDQVIELSLSTLAPRKDHSAVDDLPKQATTPTNLIQREIVKQLLYSKQPNKTPASRFQRIQRFQLCPELRISGLTGLVIAIAFLLTGWTERIVSELAPSLTENPLIHLGAMILGGAITFAFRHMFHGRINIGTLSAGSATITLDDNTASYFDQYLDEIVYFFEVSNCDIVIFEDIDRFNEPLIFETLQSLNTLLNASRDKGSPIRFIYAIKDSIFDISKVNGNNHDPSSANEPVQSEAVRANRTKFFDLIIPVVPFITHRSARNLTRQILKEINHQIDPNLITLASQYVPDMRLLKNVRNEFIVFRNRIFAKDGEELALTDTELFAMMLYKSTHLEDFEKIRIGDSSLDKLYNRTRELVRQNIEGIENKTRETTQCLNRHYKVTRRSKAIGDQLVTKVEATARAAGINFNTSNFFIDDKKITHDHLQSMEFWRDFIHSPKTVHIKWSKSNSSVASFIFTHENLENFLGVQLDPDDWEKEDQKNIQNLIKDYKDDIRFLRGADMGDLIRNPRFKETIGTDSKSLDDIARDLLNDGLAYNLVRSRYINRNFILYTSTFHGNFVSTAATNFIIRHVERNLMDEHFELNAKDVEDVISERGVGAISQPALYNIAILDYLLHSQSDKASIMINSLAELGHEQKRFIQAYMNSSNCKKQFIRIFAGISPKILIYLINQIELDEEQRLESVNDALANLGNLNYQTNTYLSDYLKQYHSELPTLTSESFGNVEPERIGKVFEDAGVRVPDLTLLSSSISQALIDRNLYQINRTNLQVVLQGSNLALDVAFDKSLDVYSYLIENLSVYLSAVSEISNTVASTASFIAVIEDVLKHDDSNLSKVISNAASNCIVHNLMEVAHDSWADLADAQRFPTTFENVNCYIAEIGSLDSKLANVLINSGKITEHDKYEDESKAKLAKIILKTNDGSLPANTRIKLVLSLELQELINVNEIPFENGALFPMLVERNIIEDSAETFSMILSADWATKERFIQNSKDFERYMTADLVQGDVGNLLASKKVGKTIKRIIADNPVSYIENEDDEALEHLAKFCIEERHELSLDNVQRLTSSPVSPSTVIELLQPHLEELDDEQLSKILLQIGGDYSDLIAQEKKKVSIPNTDENHELARKLKSLDMVRRHRRNGDKINLYPSGNVSQ